MGTQGRVFGPASEQGEEEVKAFAKKAVTAGIATISASAIAVAPSVQPPAPAPAANIRLAAQVQQAATPFDPFSITDWLGRIVIPPSLGAPFPTPQFLPQVAPTSLGSFIINAYNAIEPWVRYGFDLAAYAVGWIPYVGWLAPQITIFYNLGERITRSIAYNLGNFLNGQISFGQGLTNVAIDTINSFIFFANDQIAFWLPPLPPIPPLPGGSTVAVLNAPALPQGVQPVQKGMTAPVDVVANLVGTPLGLPGNVKGSPVAAPVVNTQVTDLKPTARPSPAIDTSNLLRKIDPFSISTALKPSLDTTTTPVNANPARDVMNTSPGTTSFGSTTRITDTINGSVTDAIKHVTDSLPGAKRGAD
jgi:hypothetical protein